jgi:hypothetical protein
MFRLTMKLSSGSQSQYLAKITCQVQCGYMEVVQRLSVLWLHNITCEVCVCCALLSYTLTQSTAHTPHRSYYAAITLTTSVRPPCIHIEPGM